MRRRMTALIVGLGLVSGAAAGLAAAAVSGSAPPAPPAASDPGVPAEPRDRGAGEHLILVVGGVFDTFEEAVAANADLAFGHIQGYYVAERSQFEGVNASLGSMPGEWLLVSAFRTQEGADQFAEFAGLVGAPALMTDRVRNSGDRYVGLGQEPATDGAGPQRGPIPGVSLK
jgi:hypothetical protein